MSKSEDIDTNSNVNNDSNINEDLIELYFSKTNVRNSKAEITQNHIIYQIDQDL